MHFIIQFLIIHIYLDFTIVHVGLHLCSLCVRVYVYEYIRILIAAKR